MKNSYKKIISVVLTIIILLTAAPMSGFVGLKLNLDWLDFSTKSSALAATGQCGDNVFWTFDESTGTLTISGTGDMYNYDWYRRPFYNNSSIKNVVIESGVTSLDDYAFSYCNGLTSITIPDSVTSIGECAFSRCTGLTSITIPDSVIRIDSSAFFEVANIVYYGTASGSPWGARSLNGYIDYPFIFSDSTKTFLLGCPSSHNGSITIPDSVTSIGRSTFSGCTGLTSVTIPDSVTSIGDFAFSGCAGLTSITIPDSVTSIGECAFSSCTGLTSVTIPDSVTSIGDYAFCDCTGLTSVTIGSGVTSIGSDVFPDNVVLICKNQYSLDYAKNGNYMHLISFVPENDDLIISENVTNKLSYTVDKSTGILTINCDGAMPSFQSQDAPWLQYKNNILKVVVNEGCTKISYNAFKDLRMSDIEIPSTVTAIDNYAFSNCARLTSFTIPDNVTTIGDYVFSDCVNLTKVVVSDKATTIGSSSFKNCFNLKGLTIPCNLYLNCYDYNKRYKFENITFTKGTGRMYNYYSESSTLWYSTKNTVKSITLEEGITSIGSYAFYNCPVSISIPSTVTSIGDYAFYGCAGMDDVVLSENVQSIGASSFANVQTIKVYNRNCTFGADCIPYNATIYGYAGSTAEAFANENGYNFEYLGEGHEHLYDNDCDTVCNICGFTRTVTHSYDSDCDDTCNICGARRTPNHHYAWVTIRNATTIEEGLAQKKCTVCGAVAEEFTIPVMIADFVTGITISPKTIALSSGETADITALITPETAANKNIIWSSTDSENVTVSGGTVTAVRPGTSVIIAETEDGGYRDFCQVRVISLTASNGAVVNSENGLVYGLSPKLGSIDGYIDTVDDSISAVCEDSVIGTGSVIQIVRDGELIDSYEAVIFGDVNSDGVYDGQDAFIVNCIANGMLTREQVGEAKFLAADCNHDGEVNSSDVLILEQAGLLLSKVEQAKDEEMKEQTLGEYLDLIDQNPEKETE